MGWRERTENGGGRGERRTRQKRQHVPRIVIECLHLCEPDSSHQQGQDCGGFWVEVVDMLIKLSK